jgi:hypothetical protein
MKHFFYAVYVLFYSGAVFMAGMFIGQILERGRLARKKASLSAVSESLRDSKAVVNISQRKAPVTGTGKGE